MAALFLLGVARVVNEAWFPDKTKILEEFSRGEEDRNRLVLELEELLDTILLVFTPKPVVKARAKDFNSYYRKIIHLMQKKQEKSQRPVVTDLIGIRVVCPFIEDMASVEEHLKKTFTVVEVDHKGATHTFKEFGYESTHLLIKIPQDLLEKFGLANIDVAEIQIRTILQDAWAEVEHELVYKAEFSPFDSPMKRKLAAVNASLSLADIIFQEIRDYQRQLNRELGQRRDSFFKKIEDHTDALIFNQLPADASPAPRPFMMLEPSDGGGTIDDFILDALYAHNVGQFDKAIALYTLILGMKPVERVCAVIYKHRGMAYFAMSKYQEALKDFESALHLDDTCYKSAYYIAVVYAVLEQYGKSIEYFTQSLHINPYQYYVLFRRSQAYFHLGDYPQALADVERALSLEPESSSASKLKQVLLEKLKM